MSGGAIKDLLPSVLIAAPDIIALLSRSVLGKRRHLGNRKIGGWFLTKLDSAEFAIGVVELIGAHRP